MHPRYKPERLLTPEQKKDIERAVSDASDLTHWYTRDRLIHKARNIYRKRDYAITVWDHDFSLAIDRLERRGTLESEIRSRGWYRWKVFRYPLPF